MNRLEDLLQTLCPDGVEYKKIGDVFKTVSPPRKLTRDNYREFGKYAIVDQGQNLIIGYTDDEKALLPIASYVVFGEHTRFVKYIHFPFVQGADGLKILRPATSALNIKYLYYAFSNLQVPSRGYNRHWIIAREMEVPVPPLLVQEEIVRILDTFSGVVAELEQKLEAEQAARVRQYEHYRNELLSFDSKSRIMEKLFAEQCLDRVQYVKLKEVAHISAGGDLPENYVKGQKVPTEQFPFPIYSNGTDDNALYGFTDNYKIEKEAVTISARGTIGYHEVRAGKFTPIVRLITMIADESKITTKFLNYVLNIAGIEGVNTGIPSLTVPMLEKITIPLPPLPIQEQIVSILDRFDTLVNDLKTGLPAEIALRRKQFEYYRDKLLTFEPKQPPL